MTRKIKQTRRKKDVQFCVPFKSQPPSALSNSSSRILKNAWKEISGFHQSSDSFQTVNIMKLPETNTYGHIPPQIRSEFEKTKQTGVECHVGLPAGRKAHIYLLEPETAEADLSASANAPLVGGSDAQITSRHSSLKSDLGIIIAWLRFVSNIADPRCAKDLYVYVLATNAKKSIPNGNLEPIDQLHANTAFTTSGSAKNEIFIFRREEWFKVFLHETFHCMGLDFSADNKATEISNQCILSTFPTLDPNTDVRLYETYCEMWAELFGLAFRLFSEGDVMKPFSSKKFREAILKEQVFSIYQSNKLLRRAGFEFKDMTVEPRPGKPRYRENTQAFSYYVLKSALLWNVDGFLRWCHKYLKNPNPLQFNPERIQEYCLLVVKSMKDEKYKKVVRQMLNERDMCGDSIRKTLRMTLPINESAQI